MVVKRDYFLPSNIVDGQHESAFLDFQKGGIGNYEAAAA